MRKPKRKNKTTNNKKGGRYVLHLCDYLAHYRMWQGTNWEKRFLNKDNMSFWVFIALWLILSAIGKLED